MSGNLEDPTQWRLRTGGGIPYKFRGMTGSLDKQSASATWKVMVPSNQLIAFMAEVFPAPLQIGFLTNQKYFTLNGMTGLVADSANFSCPIDDYPIDPFSLDPSAPVDTYWPAINVDVVFKAEKPEPDPGNPFTFLDISASSSMEVLSFPAPAKMKHTKETPKGEKDPDTGDVENQADDVPEDEDPTDEENQRVGVKKDNVDPTADIMIMDIKTEWTMRWPQIPYQHFKDVIIKRIRNLMGKVNQAKFEPLFDCPRECLMLTGWTYQQKNNWRFGREGTGIEIPPVNVELKFLEKRLTKDGMIMGHNHRYNPETGAWEYITVDDKPVFELDNFNILFKTGSDEGGD